MNPELIRFEQDIWQNGIKYIAGVDEAGRGPLAGPVVAAAVIFPPNFSSPLVLDDSKKLSPAQRQRLLPLIRQTALSVAVGIVDHKEIDRLNILQATYKAMALAVTQLEPQPELVLIDGRGAPDLSLPCRAIIKGDAKSFSIAAASIIAKETRDELMREMHRIYPQYGFARHKGYPTKAHLKAIREHGLSPIHRRSFRPRQLKDAYEKGV